MVIQRVNAQRHAPLQATLIFVTLSALLTGCWIGTSISQTSASSKALDCSHPVSYPLVQMVSPVPPPPATAVGVPDSGALVVYDSQAIGNPTIGEFAASSVPIVLTLVSSGTFISTTPTSVPSPLPSQATTPTGTLYAVALPSLAPNTLYQVYAVENTGPTACNFNATAHVVIGTFTTQ